ncbi:MAG TPA: sarcosine oxidase subunit delta [Candidatus Sumerlaeota bacterium]|nr:sarcosine oxidase subunit delta [Candidatus Sumerlaeota bacterium]HOR26687.1 sarcosine oxidase subunit delta [Candidatus Sumerlaeota bacterium]HPK03965.1 sarcosine oxidase subunit delta [Candidatus Sumerlaeota bacterium]
MKLLRCPINGLRPIQEFNYGGEYRPMPDPDASTDAQWADYVFNRDGAPGVRLEWWYHLASGVWFLAEHDTARDVFLRTFLFEELGQG